MKGSAKRGQTWLWRAVFAILVSIAPSWTQKVTASNAPEDAWRYTVMLNGVRQLKLDMPVYDEDGYDSWVDKGYVYITCDGVKETLFYYKSWDKSGSHPSAKFYKGVDGAMVMTRDRNYSSINVTTSEKEATIPIISGTDYAIIHLTWTIPYKYRGKTVTISWDIHKTGNGPVGPAGESSKNIAITSSEWNITAAPDLAVPEVMDPILSYDANHIGTLMAFYTMPATGVKRITAYWKEMNGNVYNNKSIELGTASSGFAYLPADRCIKDLYVRATYVDSESEEQTTESDPIDLPTLHNPQAMKALLDNNGKVTVTWDINHVQWGDISTSDVWELQRNTSEKPDVSSSDWMTVGMIEYEEGKSEYTFTDSLMLNDYQGHDVYYRVRRVSTSTWNWGPGSGYAMAMLPATLILPTFSKANVERAGTWTDLEHNVELQYALGGQYANSLEVKGVQFAPSVNGALATPADYQLPVDAEGRIVLRNAQDWEALVAWVNYKDSRTEHKVIMANDIDLGESHSMLGSGMPFSGVFDGNGHTLTVHYDGIDTEGAAPFTQVGDATIKNLHVTGLIRSSKKFAAGLVGTTWSYYTYKLVIENCRVSATVESTVSGDASNGGFIGMTGIPFTITDCLFDGQLLGETSHSTGGYIGAFASGKKGTFKNCLFAPTEIGTKMDDCRTFIREAQPENVTFENCYYITPYDGRKYDSQGRFVIYNSEDWDSFIKLVEEAGGNKEINAIMGADVSTIYAAGYRSNVPYYGTFDGNGHTLTVDISGGSLSFTAPFIYTKNATIKNLNVKGSVRGAIHSAGLVGSPQGSTLDIENCHVSTNVITSDHYAGGIIGHGHSVKNTIRNCLFDGSITANEFNVTSYVGAFMGWEDGGTSNTVQNNLEHATYTNFNHAGLNYNAKNSGSVWSGTNNWHFKDWGEGNKASSLSTDNLVSNLGSANWLASGNMVLPKQTLSQVGQGFNASDFSVAALDSTLGNGWIQMGSLVVPIMATSTDPEHQSIVWDDRAQVIVNVDKKVGEEVRYVEKRKVTKEENQKGVLQMNLCTSCVDHDFRLLVEKGDSKLPLFSTNEQGVSVMKKETGDLALYEFDNNVKLSEAKADTLQQGVSLSWEISRGVADYYRILRADKMQPDKVDTLKTNYVQTAYIDQTAKVQHNYIYTIEGVTQCEGDHISTVTTEGCRIPTGTVRGYVRLSNGIGLPGIEVTATPESGIIGGVKKTVKTDESGYFEIDSLKYQLRGKYSLSTNGIGRDQSITFDEDYNLFTNINFYQETYYTFSGYVLYEGSSIPVGGVQFLRDGKPVIDASGNPVSTTPQGAFEISVPEGTHTIQVMKEGHVFENDGYYIDLDKLEGDQREHNWQKDLSGIYLWDKTKVTLQGRVVGGNDQGQLELGKSLSKNNLGDDLTIIMQLEGDNTSWIVRNQLDPTETERTFKNAHGRNDKDTTEVTMTRHRITIHPSTVTGEYELPLYPVKYKVVEVYAKGYPTLFQTGMVSETLDLTNYANEATATYSRIYHAAPTLDVWQFTGTQDDFYGIKQYKSTDNAGTKDTITLWQDGKYTLGYPVFMAESSVAMLLSAREEYYKNNSPLGELDIVNLHGGKVIVNNGLVAVDQSEEVELDEEGQATYAFTPQNTTFMLEDDMALRTLKFTLMYDSTYHDVDPINAYVMAAKEVPQGRRIVAGSNAHVIDILRDPPGSSSSAYIEKGSKISYSYNADYSFQMGAEITIGLGKGSDYFTGMWVGSSGIGGSEAGTTDSHDNIAELSWDLATTYYNDWEYNYEFTTNERIETSDGSRKIGADTDVYIEMTEDIIVEDGIAVRAVNSKTLQRLKPGMGGKFEVDGHEYEVSGTAKVLARGYDEVKKDSIYLVRDEVMQVKNKIKSTFAYSQTYILDELIPNMIRSSNDLLLDSCTTIEYAQALANQQKSPAYLSTVSPTNEPFSHLNYYKKIDPNNQGSKEWPDEVLDLNNRLTLWAGFIAANEKEKLEATDLVKTYNFDGRTSVSYSESFSTSETNHRYWSMPSSVSLTGEDGIGVDGKGGEPVNKANPNKMFNPQKVEFKVGGVFLSAKITPLFGFDFNYVNGQEKEYSKETGFTLSTSSKSNLSVSVYRTSMTDAEREALIALGNECIFYKNVENNLKGIKDGSKGSSNTTSYIESVANVKRYRNFVYRTNGGATASPWEDERRTVYYNTGTLLDQKTIQINKLRIWAKEPSVSNVPFGEPARFTIYMTNESEMPALVTKELVYYSEDTMNPKGAKILIDGCPLTGTGQNLWLEPNTIVEKQVEVYANSEYDYEDLGISFYDPEDVDDIHTVNLSAHFVPSAGKINISKPGDKWVVNTESAYDKERQAYYLPVHIDGFDVNFPNFDHIELQYKLSTHGDKDWVNVCSYYRDDEKGRELMALASGEKKLMTNNGFIDADFYGEVDPIEQYYDLRAVAVCRHGNGYLTSSSNVLTGIKDTRRPVPFGTPQPTDGILGIGDDIKIAFSEPIAGNYLSPVNNFEVLGTTNQSSISLSTAIRFNGDGIAQSVSKRNLSNRDFTLDLMIHPDPNGKAMTVMSHGLDGHFMSLGVTADRRLTAFVDGHELTSDKTVDLTELRQVAYIFDVDEEQNTTKVSFYDGENIIGSGSFKGMYGGNSWLSFGRYANYNTEYTLNDWNHYEGEMLEARLWNKAMSKDELQTYAKKRLTGYELGLLDNYPMNEGHDKYAYDKAVGSNDLEMRGDATWKVPDGISLKLDGSEGVKLNERLFKRDDYEDYTLMCWFRATQDGTLIANGEARDETDYKDHFNIGLENGAPFFRSGGKEISTHINCADGNWHHLAVTVNRSRNVGNIYVDQKLKQTFPVDTIGGIDGNNLYLGATYIDAHTPTKVLTGNIDEVAMYEMALPENILSNYATTTPTGEEMGTLVYLPFSRSEVQSDNSQRLMPTGISLKKYKDNHGNVVASRRDTIVSQEIIERYADRSIYAPMRNIGKLENIKFSYVARDNELYINLDVPDYQIEKTNVYITVKEVADLQGNLMASPITMDLYAYRNPLRWKVKRASVEAMYGEGATVDVAIENLSGKAQDYTLEGLPLWITASQMSGKIASLDEETVRFTISPYINVGDYEEVVYIVGENGISEPLPINIRIRGEEPDWAVDDQLKKGNMAMHIVARVYVNGEISHDTEDMLVAVGPGHRVMGKAHIDAENNEGLAYLTVYGDPDAEAPTPLRFELYDASSGRIYVAEKQNMEWADHFFVPDTIYYQNNAVMGTSTDPVILYAQLKEVQALKLQEGWNWLSFYVETEESTVSQLLNGAATWEVGDGIELMDHNGKPNLLNYKSIYDRSTYSNLYYWDNGNQPLQFNTQEMYRFYAQREKTAYFSGDFTAAFSGIIVHQGWNRIAYNCPINLPLATALSDYTDEAQEGDIIKSQSEFAVLNIDAQGNRVWKGTLKFMQTGQGYMLRRQAEGDVVFFYPQYLSDNIYHKVKEEKFMQKAKLFHNATGASMNIIARVEGFNLQEGDRLVAFDGYATRGRVEAGDEDLFFLSIAKGEEKGIGFAIERDGEIVATAPMQLPYADNDVKGTLDEPTTIKFIPTDGTADEGWYDLSGRKLAGQPQQKGVYIHNGQKVTIKE